MELEYFFPTFTTNLFTAFMENMGLVYGALVPCSTKFFHCIKVMSGDQLVFFGGDMFNVHLGGGFKYLLCSPPIWGR